MKFPWTPLVYLVAVLVAVALHRIKPLEIDAGWQLPLQAVGVLSAAAGIWLVGWGYAQRARRRKAFAAAAAARVKVGEAVSHG